MVAEWPNLVSSFAAASPAGPPPITATLLPEGGLKTGSGCLDTALSQSAKKRCIIPEATGSPLVPMTQAVSQRLSS